MAESLKKGVPLFFKLDGSQCACVSHDLAPLINKIGMHCVQVSTAMLTKCVGEGMGKLIRNNQVQVAEVLPLYAKGTGQQGVC